MIGSRGFSNRSRLVAMALGIVAGLAVLWVAGPCGLMAAEAKPAQRGIGYDDTPFLPNSPWRVHDRRRPQPAMVTPGASGPGERPAAPPSDAIVLFDGKDLAQWQGDNEKAIENGTINIAKTPGLLTKKHFGDCQLHVEWATPEKADGGPMTWGNSGVLFLGKYEVQIIESLDSHIYADGNSGAIYGQTPALVNASRKPGRWQSFEIIFLAPRFDGDKLLRPACFTVFHNGVLVQYHKASLGPTTHRTLATYNSRETTGPILLQAHGSAVRFRNVWVRPLKLEE